MSTEQSRMEAQVSVDITQTPPVLPFGGKPVDLSEATLEDPAPEFLDYIIDEWRKSPQYKQILEGQRYMRTENDIRERKRTMIGPGGVEVEVPHLANNQIAHPFLRKLARQKVNYLLGSAPNVTVDLESLQDAVQAAIDKPFLRNLKNSTLNAISQGIGWLQAYYDEKGNLLFKRIPADEVIPFWGDIDHTDLVAAIRVFHYAYFDNSTPITIERVQYYTKAGVFNYERRDDSFRLRSDNPVNYNFQTLTPLAEDDGEADGGELPQVTTTEGEGASVENGYRVDNQMWDRIPLIPIRYNQEEQSLLTAIKSMVDAYDKRSSDVANALEEEPDKIKIVKDYDGTNKEEFIHNLATYRVVFLRDTGSIQTLDTSIDISAELSNLERLRKDIYEFGMGVDTQERNLGDASGVALKFLYADLDMDCSDLGGELSWSLEQVVWFIAQDASLRSGETVDVSIDVTYNTGIIINEKEQIENVKASEGIVSQDTLLARHPFVYDVEQEKAALAEDEAVANKRAAEAAATFQRLNPLTATGGSEQPPLEVPRQSEEDTELPTQE